jgi:hypothetical protein
MHHDFSFDVAYTMNVYGSLANGGGITPVAYRIDTASVQSGFKYELIYRGLSDGIVTVSYKEYSNDLARPAFQQDLSYTLGSGDTTVAFRNLRIEIHAADNFGINFTVISGLD